MSEMEFEGAPEVYVPRVRPWLGPAIQAWARFFFGRVRRYSLFEWFFFWWLILFYWVVKLMVYIAVIVLMLVAFGVWCVAELVTYRGRRKRAILAAWGPYMGELYEEGPPPQAA